MVEYLQNLFGGKMKIHSIPTDDTMRSLLTHGSADFPFEYYLDEINHFYDKSIDGCIENAKPEYGFSGWYCG